MHVTAPVPVIGRSGRRRVGGVTAVRGRRRSTVVLVADQMSFRDKIRTIGVMGLSNAPSQKVRVDDHGSHEVAVTEHAKGDRVDVTVRPATKHKGRG